VFCQLDHRALQNVAKSFYFFASVFYVVPKNEVGFGVKPQFLNNSRHACIINSYHFTDKFIHRYNASSYLKLSDNPYLSGEINE